MRAWPYLGRMSIHVIVSFHALSQKLPAFEQLLGAVERDLPQVECCESARVFCDTTDRTRFVLIETWSSRSQHEAHLQRVLASGGWDHLRSHLACDPTSSYYAELSALV
jgi:quinol monooxygenase YgiN